MSRIVAYLPAGLAAGIEPVRVWRRMARALAVALLLASPGVGMAAESREHTDLRMTTAYPSSSSGFAVAFDPEAFRNRMASYASAASASGPGQGTARPLRLGEVLDSVEEHFPVLLAAREEIAIAEAELVAARGGFDTRLRAGAAAEPYGFYQHELFDVGVTQPTTLGGLELDGGYRLGQGDFAVWDKGLQTNDDGEVYLGLKLPLLRGRAIDGRRLQLWKARLERERVEPEIATLALETRRDAALRYWQWVAAGEKLAVAEHLLNLAEDRQDSMRAAVEEGLIARIELADNQRLIAERSAIRVQAERALEKAAIALSFYLRDDEGEPLQPAAVRLQGFPSELEQPSASPEQALEVALASRPELRDLELYRRQLELEQRKSRNDLLPELDLKVKASQDYGAPAGLIDDKGPFELFAGVAFSLPAQRREAKGALRRKDAELRQIEQKQRLQRDRISVEVRDALSAWTQASRRIEEARRSVALAEELEAAERFQVQEGNSDLLRLNIRERQTAQASAFLVDVLQEYFEAWTRYQAVTGRAADPGALVPGGVGV
jgi:outer membrane protein TolC